ncbi:SusE outer membrane protein [Chishuiella changwenlii]|uniref:SusE outer membrane protein n=1 Tax=Chishuiella changwenlii TaxID=1434701 RepID=A0A1M6T9B7_9FLAO|nr:SusE domain-containing protein [Chishuiella changwenlii]GGE95367.1 hypothetical protein GCM10010984_11110 [Chishuiella changwenlii]SHK53662.1 SusE outer membrane protein [Chishuiella changwenlii]
MKKFLKYISIAIIGGLAITSCSDDDLLKVNPADYDAAVIATPSDNASLVLTEDKLDSTYTFKWNKAEYGLNVIPRYTLEITTKDDAAFAKAVQLTTNSTAVEFSTSYKDLNTKVLELGIAPNVAEELIYRVVSTLGTQQSQQLISAVQTITITAYPTDLSTNWGIVGSAAPNGWDGPDVQFWKSGVINVLVAYTDLKGDSEIKFRQDNKWDFDYGDNGADGTLEKGGSNIKIAKTGTYKITMNLNDLTYKIEEFSWGLVGDATPNGWDGPDTKLMYDGTIDSWVTTVTMKTGEYKFRQNDKWDVSYGGTDTPGVLTNENGGNIKITAGTYKITANFNKSTYSAEAQ